jgi:NAD(P)-dependent dehydrogenase (short-subunit alcohol dehydrogenase family)
MASKILIVGGSADIARCFATRWLGEDATRTALLHCSTSAGMLAPLIDAFGARVELMQHDLSGASGIQQLTHALRERVSTIDRVLFCAGLPFRYEKASKFDWEFFQRDTNIQLRTLVELCSLFLQNKAQQDRLRVALMLSAVVIGVPPKFSAMYATLKYAILGYMKVLAAESFERMQINALAPAMVETRFVGALPGSVREAVGNNQYPARLITPDEVAEVVHFLLEDAPPHLNGSVIPIGCFA